MEDRGRELQDCYEAGLAMDEETMVPNVLECTDEWTIINYDEDDLSDVDEPTARGRFEAGANQKDEAIDSQSDIDVIEEADVALFDGASLDSESVISTLSLFGSENRFRHDHLHEDLSEVSGYRCDELPANTELNPARQRAYVHTPNSKINVKLNVIVVLTITAVVGLGIGNYIGWSSNLNKQQLSLAQVMKLKQLQDELVVCMQTQSKISELNDQIDNTSICHGDVDYWTGKFETLFSESKGLKNLLEKTQLHLREHALDDLFNADKECATASASEEFHKLKLNVIVNQMEHLQLLKSYEAVRSQEQQSKKRVRVLESENSLLKTRLIEEEEDDKVMAETMEEKISQLKSENDALKSRIENEHLDKLNVLESTVKTLNEENVELKSALRLLQIQMNIDYDDESDELNADTAKEDNGTFDISRRLDLVRRKINQMVVENEDLKSTIGRLRYSEKEAENAPESPDDVEVLEEQLRTLQDLVSNERNEAEKWKMLFEAERAKSTAQTKPSPSTNYFQVSDFRKILMDSILGGSQVVGQALTAILESAAEEGSEIIPNEVFDQIDSTQEIVSNLHESLLSKWNSLNDINSADSNFGSQKIILKMAELLANTVKKLQDAGDKFISAQRPLEARITKFANRMDKIFEALEVKWADINRKLYKRLYAEEGQATADWYWERSKARRTSNLENHDKEDSNWMLARAKDREIQRLDLDTVRPTKKGPGWRDGKYNQYASTPKGAKPKA